MFIAALFIRKEKQPKSPATAKWITKMVVVHVIEYCLAIKRREVLIHSATRLRLENDAKSEKTATYCVIPLI